MALLLPDSVYFHKSQRSINTILCVYVCVCVCLEGSGGVHFCAKSAEF